MIADMARLRAQIVRLNEKLATDPETQAFFDDWGERDRRLVAMLDAAERDALTTIEPAETQR